MTTPQQRVAEKVPEGLFIDQSVSRQYSYLHIVQRGKNRKACYVEPEKYQYSLELWKENAN